MIVFRISSILSCYCLFGTLFITGCSSAESGPGESSAENTSATTDASQSEQDRIRWKFEKGRDYHWLTEYTTELALPQGETMVNANGGATLDFEIKVLYQNEAEATTRLRIALVRVRTFSDIPEMEFEYDSANKVAEDEQDVTYEILDEMFSPLIRELRMECLVDARGVVKEVKYEKGLKLMLQSLPNSESISALLTAKGLNSLFYGGLIPFPESPLKVGDTWEESYTGKAGALGDLILQFQPRYAGEKIMDGKQWDEFDIGLEVGLVKRFSLVPFEFNPLSAGGAFYFDPQAGIVRKSQWKMEYELSFDNGAKKGRVVLAGNSRLGFAEEFEQTKSGTAEVDRSPSAESDSQQK